MIGVVFALAYISANYGVDTVSQYEMKWFYSLHSMSTLCSAVAPQ